jgi:hypothetical protein
MVTKAGQRREARERRTRIISANITAGAVVCGLIVVVLHPTTVWTVIILGAAFLVTLYSVWTCGGFDPTWTKRIVLFIVDVAIFGVIAYQAWPRLTISPSKVSFQGYPNETFNFSARNGRSDDVYDVQIPFLIGYNKHFEDKLSARVVSNGDPPQAINIDYNYCFGTKGDGDVRHVQKNEREVLIVRITHIVPYGSGGFTITYAGGEKLDLKYGPPTFAGEPFSYSPTQGTFDVRGDYRICKVAVHANRLDEK